MRYIIIGAGAVGGTIGGCLALGGHEVVLVARGAHLAALRDHGLRLGTPSRTDTISVPAIGGPEEIVLLGREHDVPTPVNEALQRLASRAAADHLPPGSLTPEEILAAAGA